MTTRSGNDLLATLDRLFYSSANYRVMLLSDIAAALAFLFLGLHEFSGSALAGGVIVIAGFITFGPLEYAVHRWILHGPPSMARRAHVQHHAEPHALISAPLFVILAAALIVWGLLSLLVPAGGAALLVFGMYAGYNYFALLHHWQHHRSQDLAQVAYLRRLEQLHHVHHRRPAVNFGISTTIWDRLFGTFQPAHDHSSEPSRTSGPRIGRQKAAS
jgi:sterol desaturase/sphingolipid hydroxylase (fatty acid hydroxylase superfamily)